MSLDEIERNDFILNISRYVETADAPDRVDVVTALARLREAESMRRDAETRMNRLLRELGYEA